MEKLLLQEIIFGETSFPSFPVPATSHTFPTSTTINPSPNFPFPFTLASSEPTSIVHLPTPSTITPSLDSPQPSTPQRDNASTSPVSSNGTHTSASSPIITPTTSNSQNPPPANAHPMVTRGKAGIHKPKVFWHTTFTEIDPSCIIPKNYIAALLVVVWKKAMLEEFLALLRNETWILTTLPPKKI